MHGRKIENTKRDGRQNRGDDIRRRSEEERARNKTHLNPSTGDDPRLKSLH
jgi:hypothetical protein